jgi:hypothetical protein
MFAVKSIRGKLAPNISDPTAVPALARNFRNDGDAALHAALLHRLKKVDLSDLIRRDVPDDRLQKSLAGGAQHR